VLGHDHRHAALGAADMAIRLCEPAAEGVHVVGIAFLQEAHAAGLHQPRNRDDGAGAAVAADAVLGRRLAARHGRGPVVEKDEDELRPLEDGIDEGGNAGMKKCGVADGDDDRRDWTAVLGVGVVEPRPLADAGAHDVARIDGPEIHPQGVAADVAGEDAPREGFADGVEGGAVGTAGAEGRTAAG